MLGSRVLSARKKVRTRATLLKNICICINIYIYTHRF